MYDYPTRVAPSDVYADGLMTPTSMARLMQDCSQLWLESEPDMTKWLNDERVLMVIGSRQMDIVRRPAMGEHLVTTTSIYGVKAALGFRNTFIKTVAGEDIARSWSLGAFVSAETGKMVPIPQSVIDALTIDSKRDMDYAPRKIKLPKTEPESMPLLHAERGDIDFNKHVNNAQYTRMAWEYMSNNFECKRMRVEFKEQGREGCAIHPLVYSDSDRTVIVLDDDAGKPYAVVEFS